jgi:hypothetical protein
LTDPDELYKAARGFISELESILLSKVPFPFNLKGLTPAERTFLAELLVDLLRKANS